jgi:ribonuclease J
VVLDTQEYKKITNDEIRIIPLGGVGEIGKNMMLIEYANGILIIDAGMMFPEEDMPGVDFVIPDFTYVLENKNRVRAVILTHGHEDHIGALPYLLEKIDVPVYGTRLTLGFAKNRLEEYAGLGVRDFREVQPREMIDFDGVVAEFFRVCHSVADGVGIAFHTPHGCIVHSGDFKFEYTPINNHFFDFYKIAELGEKGVLLLMSDSTNAENQGHTPSEKELNSQLLDTILNADGRVLVATFASNVHRIQQLFNVCKRAEKKVAVLGRSMEKNISMARDLGYLVFPPDILFPSDRIKSYRKDRRSDNGLPGGADVRTFPNR